VLRKVKLGLFEASVQPARLMSHSGLVDRSLRGEARCVPSHNVMRRAT